MKLEFSSLEELTEFAKAAKLGKTEEIADICGRLSDLEARYDALHPKVVELERRLAGIKQEVTAEEASEALNDDTLSHARIAIIGRYGDAALAKVKALEDLRFDGRKPGDVHFLPEWREEYLTELVTIAEDLQKEAEAQQPAAKLQQPAAVTQQPEPSSDMRWHWCENMKCSEPIQIDHSVYLSTQTCPKCGTSTLHEAGTNTKKGAADERLAFLQKQRAATPAPAPEQSKYIICEVAEAPKKEPVAAPAPAPAVMSLPVADTVAVITVKDCIAYAAELRRNNADILPALKKLLDDFGIPTLNRLPEEQAGIFMQKLKELQ